MVRPLHAHPVEEEGEEESAEDFNIQGINQLEYFELKLHLLLLTDRQSGTYRGSAGSRRSNRSSSARLSLVSGGSSRSGKSNWSSHTTDTIFTRSSISTLGSLVTLGY